MKLSEEVFNHDHTIFGVLPTGKKGCRFDSTLLEQVIQGLIDEKLKDKNASMAETDDGNQKICRTFVVATSAAVAQGPPILFRSYDTHENNASKSAIWKAARATSAALSFFDPVFINVPAPGAWYVDGGLRYNNPAQVALDEARQCWPRIKRFSILSIGTGRQTNVEFVNIKNVQPPKETTASTEGLFMKVMNKVPGRNVVMNAPGAANDMLHIGKACVELSTSSEPTHEAMLALANSKDPYHRFPYYRFNVENGMDSIGLEEWKANVRIGELTEQYMRKGERKMDKVACAGILISPAPIERM
jgi:predicted acylesterase/phospholipase RssA